MRTMFDQLLKESKRYIDSILSGYGKTDLTMAEFEKEFMERYSGDRAVDHELFRKYLRTLSKYLEDFKEDLGEEIFDDYIKPSVNNKRVFATEFEKNQDKSNAYTAIPCYVTDVDNEDGVTIVMPFISRIEPNDDGENTITIII